MAPSIKIRRNHTAQLFVGTHSGHTPLSHTGKELLLGKVGHLQTNPDCPTSATFSYLMPGRKGPSFIITYCMLWDHFSSMLCSSGFFCLLAIGSLGLTISILKQQGQFSPCSSIHRHNLIANVSPVLSCSSVLFSLPVPLFYVQVYVS